MAEETVKPIIRPARFEDYHAVLAINDNVYDGTDCLPGAYYELLHDKNSNCYVMEVKGHVIAFVNKHLVNNSEGFVSMAARIHPDFKGRGLFGKLNEESTKLVRQKYPSIRSIMYTAQNLPMYNKLAPDDPRKLKARAAMLYYDTSLDQIKSAMYALRTTQQTAKPPTLLDVDSTVALAEDTFFLKKVAKSSTIIHNYWAPVAITRRNMKELALQHGCLASHDHLGHVTMLSYGIMDPICKGIEYLMFALGESVPELLAHTAAHLQRLERLYNKDIAHVFCAVIPTSFYDSEALRILDSSFSGKRNMSTLVAERPELVTIETRFDSAVQSRL